MNKQSVIVVGPQGCGKSRNAEVIRKHYGLGKVVDGFSTPLTVQPNTLYLTNVLPHPAYCQGLEVVMFNTLVRQGVVK